MQAFFDWSVRLGQHVAYDAQYLAHAEELDADFWSADHKLVNTLHHLNFLWAHWVGEIKSCGK